MQDFVAARPGAGGVEQARDAHGGRLIVEQREQVNRLGEDANQQPVQLREILRARGPGRQIVLDGFEQLGERVDKSDAGLFVVCAQTHEVAPVRAPAGNKQVVALAPGDAVQLKLTRRRALVVARTGQRKRQADEAFNGGAGVRGGLARALAPRAVKVA